MDLDKNVLFEHMTCPPIIQHCERCGKAIAQYTLIEDMKDGEDIYGRFKWFQASHNYTDHPKWYHRMFWLLFDELYYT